MANKIVRETIHAKGIDIGIYTNDFENEYISLTDIAKYRNDNDPRFVIQNWMRNRNTVEFLAVWEELHNPDFNRVQFEAVRSEAGLNRFVMTPTKWIEQTNAIGIVSKAGRYGGGTYAHNNVENPIFSMISIEYLNLFDLSNVKDMIGHIGKYMGLNFDEEIYTKLTEDYGGHPFLIRHICSLINKDISLDRPCQVSKYEYATKKKEYDAKIVHYVEMILGVLKTWYPKEYLLKIRIHQNSRYS